MRVRVLKPFALRWPGGERRFSVGEVDLPPEIADHPFIQAGADGAIESTQQAQERQGGEIRGAILALELVAQIRTGRYAGAGAIARKALERIRSAIDTDSSSGDSVS
jgi:hypothetical protein